MELHPRHAWDLTPEAAVSVQRALRGEIVADRPIDLAGVRLVAGVDVSVKNERSRAAIVVATFPDFRVVETALAERPTPFPYIPGLLSFRYTRSNGTYTRFRHQFHRDTSLTVRILQVKNQLG